MPQVGFEATIPAFEPAKIVHALDHRSTVTHTIQRRITKRLVNNKLERTWREAVVALFEVLSRDLPGIEENHEEPLSG
jgi:hypothetical protein